MINQNNSNSKIGKIIKITDSVIDLEFNTLPNINNLIKIITKDNVEYTFEVLQHLTITSCRALAYQDFTNLACDDLAIDTGKQVQIPTGQNSYQDLLNKTFDSLGNCINSLNSDQIKKIDNHNSIPRLEELTQSQKLIYTGIPIVDLLFPLAINSKIAIFTTSNTNNNLYYNLIKVFTKINNNPIVFVEVAKSLKEIEELDSRIDQYDLTNRSIRVQSQTNQTAINRLRSVTSGIAIVSNLRDINQQDSFFFLDGGMECLQANVEISKLLGKELPNVASNSLQIIANIEEKISSTKKANITSIQKILVTEPTVNNFLNHLDSTLVLDKDCRINYQESYSKNLTRSMVGSKHVELAFEVNKILSNYKKIKEKITNTNWNDLTLKEQEEVVKGKKIEDLLYSNVGSNTKSKPDISDFDSLLDSVENCLDLT